jgi:ribose transport system substrate-binding protein
MRNPITATTKTFGGRAGIGVLAVVVLSAVLLTACGSSSSSSDSSSSSSGGSTSSGKTVHIALVGYADANNYTQSVYQGMKEEAGKDGASVDLIDGQFEPKAQSVAMQNAIQSGSYEAFVVMPNDAVSLTPQVKAAASAGMPVIALDYTFGPLEAQEKELAQLMPEVSSTIGVTREENQHGFAENIEAACTAKVGQGKPCKVAILPGSLSVAWAAEDVKKTEAFLAEGAPNISVSVMPEGGFSKPGGYKSATTFLQNNKDIDVLQAQNDEMAAGAAQALEQAGLTPGEDVYLTAFGATAEGVEKIKDGTWFASVGLYPKKEGVLATEQAVELVEGKKVPPVTNTYELPGALPNVNAAILKENPEFEGDWSAGG